MIGPVLSPCTKPFIGLQSGSGGSARTSCETKPDIWLGQQCLAVIYEKLKRHADAEAELSKLKANGDAAAYQYATIYAQWGNSLKALESLETALGLRDPGLVNLKTDPLVDPLRVVSCLRRTISSAVCCVIMNSDRISVLS